MNIQSFRPLFPKKELISSLSSYADSVKALHKEHRQHSFYQEPQTSVLLVYQIQREHSSHVALLCTTAIEDSRQDKILKHELTLAVKEQEMMHRIMDGRAMVKPIVLTYPEKTQVTRILASYLDKEPVFELYDEEQGQGHRFWTVTESDERELLREFGELDHAYIADGHHRNAVISRLYDQDSSFDRIFTAYYSFDQLEILDYNRILQPIRRISGASLLAQLSQYCTIELGYTLEKPQQERQMTLWVEDEVFILRWKPEFYNQHPTASLLDVDLFNRYILQNIFDIHDVRNDPQVKYAPGAMSIDEIYQKLLKTEQRIGFLLYPVRIEQLIDIVDAGATMPPKSTWFEPRLVNGLVCNEYPEPQTVS